MRTETEVITLNALNEIASKPNKKLVKKQIIWILNFGCGGVELRQQVAALALGQFQRREYAITVTERRHMFAQDPETICWRKLLITQK